MSDRATSLVERWISDYIDAEGCHPKGDDSWARRLAAKCLEAANAKGITQVEIAETFDDLAAFIAGEMQNAHDREAARLAETMPTFYLEPKDGDMSNPRWVTTFLKEGAWVKAESQDDARRQVEMATLQMADVHPGQNILHSPWSDPTLSTCSLDDQPPDVPYGKILTRSGRFLDG